MEAGHISIETEWLLAIYLLWLYKGWPWISSFFYKFILYTFVFYTFIFYGSVTFSSKIKRISADHPPGPVIGRRDIEVLCDWAAIYSPLLLAEL